MSLMAKLQLAALVACAAAFAAIFGPMVLGALLRGGA